MHDEERTYDTSTQAYHENLASGLIGQLQEKVYTALFRNPHLTAGEVANRPELTAYQINTVNPRFAELERAKLVRKSGTRECAVTGHTVHTWVTTDHIATAADFIPRPSRRDLEATILRLEAENTRLRQQMQDTYDTETKRS